MDKNNFKSGFIGIVGCANVGKSTLLNSILGRKISITSPKPQTTRSQLTGIYSNDNMQLVFIDTPGIHKSKDIFGKFMNKESLSVFKKVDLIFYIVNVVGAIKDENLIIIKKLKKIQKPVFLLLNKIDLIKKDFILPVIKSYEKQFEFKEIIPISALKKNNIDYLLKVLSNYIETGDRFYPENIITNKPREAIINDIIREKIILYTQQEVPHSVAVTIDRIKEKNNIININSSVYVERISQKGILIGKNGIKIKQIRKESILDIEKLYIKKVNLDLNVKVKKMWKRKEDCLEYFGYKN